MGRIVGFVFTTGAVVTLVQYPLSVWTNVDQNGNFFPVNVVMVLLCSLTIFAIFWYERLSNGEYDKDAAAAGARVGLTPRLTPASSRLTPSVSSANALLRTTIPSKSCVTARRTVTAHFSRRARFAVPCSTEDIEHNIQPDFYSLPNPAPPAPAPVVPRARGSRAFPPHGNSTPC